MPPDAASCADRRQVLIAGGGIAGLEAALALHDLAGERVEVTLVAPDPEFLYKPLTVEEPFTGSPAERHELEPLLADLGARYVSGAVERVDVARREVSLDGDRTLGYDDLIVCVGGRPRPAYRAAETFWSASSDLPVDDLLERAAASEHRTLALVVPQGTSWPLPLYELALQLRRRSEEGGHGDVRLRLFTPEDAPLGIFGRAASDAVGALLEGRRIELEPDSWVVEGDSGELELRPQGGPLPADVVIALPRLVGPAIEGLPADDNGFLPIDDHGRVRGASGVYAAGDGTDFPVKQGGIATQQADAVAEHIAAAAGAEVEAAPFTPVLRGQLVTGAESLHMRHGLTGGHGEGVASLDYLWWPPQKVSGRYLSAWLSHSPPTRDLDPPDGAMQVEVSLPQEWHGDPMFSHPGEKP